MNKIIVTTTINPPTEATLKFAAMSDWHMVIAGDLKTPHDAYNKLQNVTLSSTRGVLLNSVCDSEQCH